MHPNYRPEVAGVRKLRGLLRRNGLAKPEVPAMCEVLSTERAAGPSLLSEGLSYCTMALNIFASFFAEAAFNQYSSFAY
jgi:hypothetical protein